MTRATLLTALLLILALGGLLPASPSLAQTGPVGPVTNPADSFGMGANNEYRRNIDKALSDAARESEREMATRLRDDATAARAAATGAGVTCEVTEAILLGRTDDGLNLYETACASGPGYLVTASEPPVATGCVIANTAAAHALEANPSARPPASCTLPANLNVDAAMAGYAAAAGVTCVVDEGRAIGQVEGRAIYEIGCAGRDGARIAETATGWSRIPCLAVVRAGSTCAFTTTAEQYATLAEMLGGTAGAGCVVDGGRYMGASANGTYYEAKCSGAEGYVVRVRDGASEAFACAEATGVGGGCTLTPVASTVPAPTNRP